jgi:hypothetical protein
VIPLRPVPWAQLGVVEGKSKPGRAAHDVEGDITRNGCCAYPKLAPVLSALSLDQCTEGNFEVLHPEPAHKYLGFSAAELFPLREALRDFSRKPLDFTISYTAILKLSLYMPGAPFLRVLAQGWESMNTQSDNSMLPLRHAEPQDITDPAQRGQHRVQLQQRLQPPVSAAPAGDHHARWRELHL